jgi:hypothetical protein
VVDDPQGLFKNKKLNPYKIAAQIGLAKVQMQLGFLELAQGKSSEANKYFKFALENSDHAYRNVKTEINRLQPEAWINEGVSINLRNIYFNLLLDASRIRLELAKVFPERSKELITQANNYVEEALQNKEMIIFGSTKEDVYKTALWALTAQAETLQKPEELSTDKLISILEIDTFTENSFGVRDLQLLALALLVWYSLKTSPNFKEAEKKFTQLLPWKKINRPLRTPLGLEDKDLEHTEKAFTSLIAALLRQHLIPEQIKKVLSEARKQQ